MVLKVCVSYGRVFRFVTYRRECKLKIQFLSLRAIENFCVWISSFASFIHVSGITFLSFPDESLEYQTTNILQIFISSIPYMESTLLSSFAAKQLFLCFAILRQKTHWEILRFYIFESMKCWRSSTFLKDYLHFECILESLYRYDCYEQPLRHS